MTRRMCFLLTLVLLLSVLSPICANADTLETDSSSVYVEYEDFFANEDYYHNLAKEEGYTIYIHIDEDHEEDILERLSNYNNSGTLIGDNTTRGLNMPTDIYNVAEQGVYGIDGWANSGTLYTEYKFTGIKGYGVAVYNFSHTDTLGFYARGFYEFGGYFTLDPRYCMFKYMTTYYTTDKVYLEFQAPCYVSGYIGAYYDVKDLFYN